MGITQMKIILMAAGFVLIFLTGYLLYRTGQPFSAGVLALHKLISVAAIVYLVVTVLSINKMVPLDKAELTVCIVTGLFFLGAVATGPGHRKIPVVAREHKIHELTRTNLPDSGQQVWCGHRARGGGAMAARAPVLKDAPAGIDRTGRLGQPRQLFCGFRVFQLHGASAQQQCRREGGTPQQVL